MKSTYAALVWALATVLLAGLAVTGSRDAAAQEKKGENKKDEGKKGEPKEEPKKPEIPKDKTPPLATIEAHKDWINSVAYSPDGKFLVTASRDRTVKVWDAESGKEVKAFEMHPQDVRTAVFAPDGKTVVSTTGDWDKKENKWEGEIRFLDLASGQVTKTLKGHTDTIRDLAFSPDGKLLATAGDDQTAVVWEVGSGKPLQTLKGHKAPVLAVAFSPDGTKVATAASGLLTETEPDPKAKDKKPMITGTPPEVKVWETGSGKELLNLTGPKQSFTSVAFSPDGKQIAAGSLDNSVTLWGQDGKLIRQLDTPAGIWSVSYSPDGKYLAASGWDDTMKVWNAESGQELFYRNGHERTVTNILFSPDGRRLVTSSLDETVKIWEVPQQK